MQISTEDTAIDLSALRKVQADKKWRKNILVKVWVALIFLTVGFWHIRLVPDAGESDSAEGYLAETGMSVQEIGTLDDDARQFIADDLRNAGEKGWKVNTDILTMTKTASEQYTVVFYINIYAFQAETEHRIYAVYESSTGIMPTGNDSLFLGLGNSFEPYEYGGRIWYKRAGDGNWIQGGGLTADGQTLEGGIFTGRQLGDFQRKMLVKGCVYCYAREAPGEDNGVTVEYIYKPPKESDEAGLYILIVTVTVIIVLILRKRE